MFAVSRELAQVIGARARLGQRQPLQFSKRCGLLFVVQSIAQLPRSRAGRRYPKGEPVAIEKPVRLGARRGVAYVPIGEQVPWHICAIQGNGIPGAAMAVWPLYEPFTLP